MADRPKAGKGCLYVKRLADIDLDILRRLIGNTSSGTVFQRRYEATILPTREPRYVDATRMGTFRGRITEYRPPSQIGFRETLRLFGSDLMEARPGYRLEADGDSTIVHHVAEGELIGVMRVMKPVAALLARSERRRTVESLRRSRESE